MKYMKTKNRIINIDELTKEVNKWDKKFGVKLKAPEMWRDPENFFNILASKADMNIAALICCLNGINPEKYYGTDGKVPNQDINIENISFLEDSVIEWNSDDIYDTDSYEFRIRFVSLTLSQLIGSMGQVALNYTLAREPQSHSIYEHATINLVKISKMCTKFIHIMLSNGKYENIILFMNELISYTSTKKNSTSLQSCLNGHVLQLRKSVVIDPVTKKRFFTEDMSIYSILKIAYMLTTGKTNLKALPGFEFIENATLQFNMGKLIEALGHVIVENKKINKLSPMFKCFLSSKPKIMSDFYTESEYNYYLRMGILALGYTSFIMDNKYITKFIKSMIKKKGKL